MDLNSECKLATWEGEVHGRKKSTMCKEHDMLPAQVTGIPGKGI